MIDLSGEWLLAAVAAALALLTFVRPSAAVVLVMCSLPLFVHKTASAWGLRFFILLSVFEAAYALRHYRSWRAGLAVAARNRIVGLGSLYVAASVASLSSLPLLAIVRQHSADLTVPGVAWAAHLAALLTVAETDRVYPLLTVAQTLEAFAFCLIVWREARRSPSFLPATALGITAALATFVGLGLLEFEGVISLRRWRGDLAVYFDPAFTRLHSIAGNPGWFAEQVVYSMAFAVVMLTSGPWRVWRLAGLPVLLAGVCLALVLSLQRGGWIAAIAVMLFLAAVLLTSGLFGSETRSLRRGCLRVALVATASVTVTAVAFSLSLLNPRAPVQDTAPYLTRLKSITDKSARLPFFRLGYQLGTLHPVLGGGSESYAYRYVQHFVMDGGAYKHHQPLQVEFFPSAHNVYLQTFAGKGLVGLLLLLGIFVSCFAAALPILITPAAAPDPRRLSLIAATGSLVGFGVYGLFQEIFYIPSLQLLFFAVVGMIAALTHERVQWGPGIRRALWAALAVAFAAHLVYEYVYPGPTRVLRGEPTGFFAEERDPAGVPFRWTTDRAWVPVPPSAKTVSLEVRSVAPYKQQTDVKVCGQRLARLEMTNQDWRPVQSQTPVRACQSLPYLEIRTVPAWVPGADPRLLGVMVRKIEFR